MSGLSLTPIRIRGKKAHRQSAGTGTKTGTRTAGRRLLSLAERNQSLKNRRNRRLKRTRLNASVQTGGKTSQLERLPVELVEKIFVYSLNVNFARASPYLAAAVSSERIYRLLILLAFSWDGPVTSGVERILRYDSTPVVDDRTALQEDILRCRWCTADRVGGLLPELSRLAVQRFWFDEGVMDSELDCEASSSVFHGTFRDQPYTLTLTPTSLTISCPTSTTNPTPIPILNLRAIPAQVLDSIPLLETLRVAGGLTRLDHEHMAVVAHTVRVSPALQTAIHHAVSTANLPALRCLLKLDEYIARCENVAATATATATAASEAIPYTVPAELFRIATRHPLPTAVDIMLVLLRASAESLPDDADITAFAMECCANNVGLGSWLLDFMLDLPRLRDLVRESPARGLFYLGRANDAARVQVWGGDLDTWL